MANIGFIRDCLRVSLISEYVITSHTGVRLGCGLIGDLGL